METTLNHSTAFRFRRFLNWFPLGLAYAFLYMGRYNLTVSKMALGNLMSKEDFGIIFGIGTVTYAFSFLINGPLIDKIGGKKGMMIAMAGSSIINFLMGIYISTFTIENATTHHLRIVFTILYSLNMYFQSYGALSIVKINSHWFHVKERGGFSGIFGTMISLGIFLAFTVNAWILSFAETTKTDISETKVVFFAPAILLALMFVFEFFVLKDRPGLAGHIDFDTEDASSGEENENFSSLQIMKKVITHPVLITIAGIEFCTGVIRNGVMHWFPIYSKEVLKLPKNSWLRHGSWSDWKIIVLLFIISAILFTLAFKIKSKNKAYFYILGGLLFLAPFTMGGWGGLLMVAGVLGGNIAGWVSDLFFQSRRGPAAGGLYGMMIAVIAIMIFVLKLPIIMGVLVLLISVSVIGTHGLMSGTATMDFGGRKGAATAVGMIDGFVYLGTGVQSFALGYITSKSWAFWPVFLLPFAIAGFLLTLKIWNAKPKKKLTA